MNKPFSPAADRNKEPILHALKPHLSAGQLVLEIGSGTGQHACFFANTLNEIIWQPTELESNFSVLRHCLESDIESSFDSRKTPHQPGNILDAVVLDVDEHPWPIATADICYTCNTLHIMSMQSVHSLLKGCENVIKKAGKLCVYGPFKINGTHTSESNSLFDQQLRKSDAASGIRDLTELDELAQQHGFSRCTYSTLPANNLFVVWERLR